MDNVTALGGIRIEYEHTDKGIGLSWPYRDNWEESVSGDFWLGLLVGFLIAGGIGILAQQLRFHYKRWKQASQPQVVFRATEKTPLQVVAGSLASGCLLVLLALLAVVVMWWALNSV